MLGAEGKEGKKRELLGPRQAFMKDMVYVFEGASETALLLLTLSFFLSSCRSRFVDGTEYRSYGGEM